MYIFSHTLPAGMGRCRPTGAGDDSARRSQEAFGGQTFDVASLILQKLRDSPTRREGIRDANFTPFEADVGRQLS